MAALPELEAVARVQWHKKKNLKENLLIIFTRNPEEGKVKTRLAKDIGDKAALEIYKFLLEHTASVTRELKIAKCVYYSEEIRLNDLWDNSVYEKKLQKGKELGERMENAFREGFAEGYKKVAIIGSDLFDLQQEDLEEAFLKIEENDIVLGPAQDGGYYLIGMKSLTSEVFRNKDWGTNTILQDTLKDLSTKKVELLEVRNDVDVYEDIKDRAAFQKFLKQ